MTDKARQYAIKNYKAYNLGLNSPDEMENLLNILEAFDETLDSLHASQGDFLDFYFSGPVSDADIAKAILNNCSFFTESEFIDRMIEGYQWLKSDGYDAADYLKDEANDRTDTIVIKTGRGYVTRTYC